MRFTAMIVAASLVAGCVGDDDPGEFDLDPDKADHGSSSSACTGITVTQTMSAKAREFMSTHGMIETTDEVAADGVVSKWRATKTVASNGQCLVVMNLAITAFGVTSDSEVFEVVVAKKSGGNISFRKFEDARSVPATIRVAIGSRTPDHDAEGRETPYMPKDLYYMELAGAEAVTAAKTIAAGLTPLICGLRAKVSASNVHWDGDKIVGTPDGKASFDPTPGRTWKLKDAQFYFRRGMSPETEDGRPQQYDDDFDAYFSGSAGGSVAPWQFCFLRKIAVGTTWKDLPPLTPTPSMPLTPN